ncbi:diacylglycerol kinase family protein [Salinicoccus siamensis]
MLSASPVKADMKWLDRFKYAVSGIRQLLEKDSHFALHTGFGLIAIAAGAIIGIDRVEWLFILSAVFFVLVAEAFNTALETAVDLAEPAHHPLAGAAKDMAAGGVLLSSIYAASVGLIVFIPYLI